MRNYSFPPSREFRDICLSIGLNSEEIKLLFQNQLLFFRLLSLYPDRENLIKDLMKEFNEIKKSASKIFKQPSDCVTWSLYYFFHKHFNPLLHAEIYAFSYTLGLSSSQSASFAEFYWQANKTDYQNNITELDTERIKYCCVSAYTYCMISDSKNTDPMSKIFLKLEPSLAITKKVFSLIVDKTLELIGRSSARRLQVAEELQPVFASAYKDYWNERRLPKTNDPPKTKQAAALYAKGILFAKKTFNDSANLKSDANIYVIAKKIGIPDEYLEIFRNAYITKLKPSDALIHAKTVVSDKLKENIWELDKFKNLNRLEKPIVANYYVKFRLNHANHEDACRRAFSSLFLGIGHNHYARIQLDKPTTAIQKQAALSQTNVFANAYKEARENEKPHEEAIEKALYALFFEPGYKYAVTHLNLNQEIRIELDEVPQAIVSSEEQAAHFAKAYVNARGKGKQHENAIEYASDMLALFRDNLTYFKKDYAETINASEDNSNGAYKIAKKYKLSPFYMRKFCQYYHTILIDPTINKEKASNEALRLLYLEEYYHNNLNILESQLFKKLLTSKNKSIIEKTLQVIEGSNALMDEIKLQIKEPSIKETLSNAFKLTLFKPALDSDEESGNTISPNETPPDTPRKSAQVTTGDNEPDSSIRIEL